MNDNKMAKLPVTAAAILGFVAGGVIGLLGAPAWEMAGIFVAFFASVAGALTAYYLASQGNRIVAVGLSIVAPACSIGLLSQGNPQWVTVRCVLAVVAAGLVGCLIGYMYRTIEKLLGTDHLEK